MDAKGLRPSAVVARSMCHPAAHGGGRGIAALIAAGLLAPDALVRMVELMCLRAVSRLATLDRTGSEAVHALFGKRLAHLSQWARGIWTEPLRTVRDAAYATASLPLPFALQRSLLDALVEVAAARNRFPLRVRALCYTRLPDHVVMVRFDFKCPRRHGMLQQIRGVPTEYIMHHNTDDLTLACTNCNRGLIEEDPMIFHCPRFGCCYDLCLICAEELVRHRS